MAEKYIKESDVYNLFPQCGIAKLHVAQIDELPRANVVEVVHAVKAVSTISKTGLMCMACHSDVDRDVVWCKYCGAKMDGKENAE